MPPVLCQLFPLNIFQDVTFKWHFSSACNSCVSSANCTVSQKNLCLTPCPAWTNDMHGFKECELILLLFLQLYYIDMLLAAPWHATKRTLCACRCPTTGMCWQCRLTLVQWHCCSARLLLLFLKHITCASFVGYANFLGRGPAVVLSWTPTEEIYKYTNSTASLAMQPNRTKCWWGKPFMPEGLKNNRTTFLSC